MKKAAYVCLPDIYLTNRAGNDRLSGGRDIHIPACAYETGAIS